MCSLYRAHVYFPLDISLSFGELKSFSCKAMLIVLSQHILGLHVTSWRPCWWNFNKRMLISFYCTWHQHGRYVFVFWISRDWLQTINCTVDCRIGTLSKRGQQRKRREVRQTFLRNPRILLSISLLWLPCIFLFSLKFRWLQRLLLNETWTLVLEMSATFWRQRGNGAVEVSFESRTAQMSALFHIFMCTFGLL